MRVFVFLACAVLPFFFACTTEKEKIVPDNTINADTTITLLEREAYVNRLYITLLGRKPEASESQQALQAFETDGCGPNSRSTLVNKLMGDTAFSENLYRTLRREYLNDLDTATIRWQIEQWNRDLERLDRENPVWAEIVRLYIVKLEDLRDIPQDLSAGRIGLAEAQRRCVDNNFYDEINMGTENFVVSCFSHFLSRYPTMAELEEGKKIVDAQPGQLFGQYGRSKLDFLDIFFAANSYYEGQVQLLYQRFLYRAPTPDEWSASVSLYRSSGDYRALWRRILTSTDYVRSR